MDRALTWKEDLRVFLEVIDTVVPAHEHAREQYILQLKQTLETQVYPGFEEFLEELSHHSRHGRIYGRGTGWFITLRLDDGFEISVERDRHRECPGPLPRLICVCLHEEKGRQYFTTDGIAWDDVEKDDVLTRLVEEYKHWRLRHLLEHGLPAKTG